MIKLIQAIVLGIPALIAALFAQLGRKWVTVTATIALMITLTTAFIVAINNAVSALSGGLSAPGWISNAVGMFVPSNFALCLSSIVTAHIARAAYDLAMDKARMFNTGT
jgi:hypothetical protein